MELMIRNVYILAVEFPGDYIFTPSGVVVVLDNGAFKVYCVSSSHNLFRAALHRFPWDELEKGIVYRETGFRLNRVTDEIVERGWNRADSIPDILAYLYSGNPKQLFFLKKQVENVGNFTQ